MPSILQTQMAIIEEFEAFDDWEERYKHLIQVGRSLEGIPAELQQDEHKVRGCSSSVWLLAEHNDGTVHFQADSDAVLVRGLVALLMRVYDQRSPQEILDAEPAFIEELGLNTHLSANRANGLAAMVKQIMRWFLHWLLASRGCGPSRPCVKIHPPLALSELSPLRPVAAIATAPGSASAARLYAETSSSVPAASLRSLFFCILTKSEFKRRMATPSDLAPSSGLGI